MTDKRISDVIDVRITDAGDERILDGGTTWDLERSKSGKHPWQWIEIEVDRCDLIYGVAPCTAAIGVTGNDKCFNSWETCQDEINFDPSPYFIRFCEPVEGVPTIFAFSDAGLMNFLPFLISNTISHQPGLPDPGESLGSRTRFSVQLNDAPHHDIGIDKYVTERAYDPVTQGTFLRKLKARFPHYVGRRLRWYQGYLTSAPSINDFRKREYIIESLSGPDSNGRVTIVAKDILKLIDDKRAEAPRRSKGELAIALDAVTNYTQIDIETEAPTEYDLFSGESVDYVRIGEEIFTYTGTTPISGGVRLTGVTRAAPSPYVTVKSTHAIDDAVQRCRYFQGTIPEVVNELFTEYGNVGPQHIPFTAWANEAEVWLAGDNIQRLVTEPEGVNSLVNEIISQTLTWGFWYDEVDQLINFRAIHPPDVNEQVITIKDGANIVADSVQITDMADQVINEVQVLYGQINPVEGEDEVKNYRRGLVLVDADSQGTNELRQRRIKRIFARWQPAANSAVVLRHATRLLKSRTKNLITVQFQLERKDESIRTSQFADLTTLYIIDRFGTPITTRVQVMRVDSAGEQLTFRAREDFFKGAFSRWAPVALNGLLYDSATADQKATYLFWADSDGKLGAANDNGKTWS